MKHKTAYIVDGIRTPFGNFGGSLSAVRADDLAAHVIKAIAERNPAIPLESIDEVLMGCANQAGEDNRNVARMALLLAGLPVSVPGETINRLCASGMSAVVHASRAIKAGDGDVFIAGGVEHMTRAPWVISKASKPFGRDARMYDSSFGWRFINSKMERTYGIDSMGDTAENLADRYQVSREDQDRFACWSQRKAAEAQHSGRLAKEICEVEIPQRKANPILFSQDEFIKANTTQEILARLEPAFKKAAAGGSVTAGNASGLNDGAAAMLMASEEAIDKHQLQPMAKVVSSAVAGVEPRIMGIGPVEASRRALAKAGITLDDIGTIEINEAFAVQSLACTRALGLDDNDPRINPNGGAIAIGHPLGASGARITYSAALQLQQSDERYALAAMCVGVGQGCAIVLEQA